MQPCGSDGVVCSFALLIPAISGGGRTGSPLNPCLNLRNRLCIRSSSGPAYLSRMPCRPAILPAGRRPLASAAQLDRSAGGCATAREFCRIVGQRDAAAWSNRRQATSSGPLANTVKHLLHDEAAWRATAQHSWNNSPGTTSLNNSLREGHVHRLKLIKHSGYDQGNYRCIRIERSKRNLPSRYDDKLRQFLSRFPSVQSR